MSTQIQELLAAETRASAIVADARAARTKRMKEAKKEAAQLENAYRAEMETSYKASMQKSAGSTGKEENTLGQQTETAIKDMTRSFHNNKKNVVDMLVREVCNIVLVVPEGLKSRDMPRS